MEDPRYLANLLWDRACALCGQDRRRTLRPHPTACARCGAPTGPDDALFVVRPRGAFLACGPECFEAILKAHGEGGEACPLCAGLWREAVPAERSCISCAARLDPAVGYGGLWRGGRLAPFCGRAGLEAYLRRANPFCG